MPRIPPRLLPKARKISPFLPALLAPCRSLPAACNELRWLREHVERVVGARRARGDMGVKATAKAKAKAKAKGALLRQLVRERARGKPLKTRRSWGDTLSKAALLRHLVRERARGKPLQYLLGTEYFGDLEIKCEPGVLIPRCVWEMSTSL